MRRFLAVLAFLTGFLPAFAAAQAPPPVPALPDTERRTSYALTASTCPACSVGFALYGTGTDYSNWLELWIVTGSGTAAVATKLTAVTDWTLSSATGPLATIPRPITNATITLTTARTGTLQIVGANRPRRLSQLAENRGVAGRDVNQIVTDLVAENREQWDKMGRALFTAPGDTIGVLPAAAVRAGGVLAFNGSGDPIVQSALTGLGNVVGPNVSIVGHIATFGNTSGTILLDGGLVGAGDVVGPASAIDNQMAVFSGTGGKTIKATGPIVSPSTGTITLTNAKTLTVTNTMTLGATDGSTVTFGAGGTVAYVANNLSVFAATTSAQLAGVISDETGTGALVFANTPTLVTPVLGVATATSINKVAITAPATSATLTIADGKTLTASKSITLAGNDSQTLTLNASLTVATNDGTLAFGAAFKTLTVNNSIGISGVDAKVLTVNNSGTLAGGDAWTLAIAASKTLTVSNTLTFTGTDSTSFAFPSTSDTVVTLTAAQTLTNKTLTSPTINGGTATALTGLGIRSVGAGAFDLTLANTETLTAGRTLTLTVNNAARTINLGGNLTIAAGFTTTGGSAITLTATGATGVTLPTSGTLAAIDIAQTFSSTNIFSAVQQFTDAKFSSGKIYPTGDSTTALQLCKADGTTCFVRADTTNQRLGIGGTPGAFALDVTGATNVSGALTFGNGTITGLTVNNSPIGGSDYLLYYDSANNRISRCTIAACSSAATAGVSSLNGLTGGLSIVQGTGMTVSAGGSSVTVAANIAAQSDQETATSTILMVTPGRQQFHPSAAKAWASWTGSTGALLSSYNVTSVSRSGAGQYTVNFTTNFSSANFTCVAGVITGALLAAQATTSAAGNVAVAVNTYAGVSTDPSAGTVICYGDQ